MLKKAACILLSALLLASATACGGNANESVSSGGASPTTSQTAGKTEDGSNLPTVTVGFQNTSDYDSTSKTWPTDIFKDFQEAVREKCGITLQFKGWADNQAFELALASNDLPDMFEASSQYINPLLNGDHILALDDYLNQMPNFTALSKTRIAAMRKYYSKNNDGKLYFWTPFIGTEPPSATWWNGLTMRWDYYKELGYPEIKSEDDFLKVVKQALQKHPTTADGKKVYGIATFSDGTLWGWWVHGCMYGYSNITDSYALDYRNGNNTIVNNYMDLESPVWRDISFYYKANQMDLFDPDSLTMKGDDLNALATNGQLIATNCAWYGGKLTANELAKDPDSLAEYMVIPVEGQYNWGNGITNIGWTFYNAVNKNTQYPQQIMKLIDYINSPEGARMGVMGKEGHIWSTVDSKPTIKQEYIDINKKGGDEATIKTSGVWEGFFGPASTTQCKDGGPVNLWKDVNVLKNALTPAEKDFSSHYGVTVPAQAAKKLIQAGKAYDQSGADKDLLSLLPSSPQDVTRIDTKCLDIMVKAIPKLVLAKNDAEFKQIQNDTLASFKAAGVDTSIQWWKEQETSIKAFLASVKK